MELAIGMMSLIGGSAAAGGAAAGATSLASWLAGTTAVNAAGATVFSGAAAGGASALSMLQGAFTAASVLGSLGSGLVGLGEADQQARATEMTAERQALEIRRETLKKIGDSRAAFAASGVTLASSAPVEASLTSQGAREEEVARLGGRISSGQIRLRGTASLLSSSIDALDTMARGTTSIAKRGV